MSIIKTTADVTAVNKASRLVFASALQASVVLPAVAADLSLPSVAIASGDIPSGATITRVLAAVAWRKQVDSSAAANAVNGAQNIQVQNSVSGTWTNAIAIATAALSTAASATEGGVMIIGAIDIKAEVTGTGTYSFQWASALVTAASLTLYDVQTYLIVEFTTSS